MKKNISINISGIIFHIEEDAYERLRDYLDTITNYFSSFDGSQEIIADIESRIAEIFLAKLNEEKQIITAEDVDALITTMGSIKDFQAVEEPSLDEDQGSTYEQTESESTWSDIGSKKLYRDENRKLLGGVCAGIAHYFSIDPLWVRLLLIILAVGSYGVLVVIYIILWIALPPNTNLAEDKKIKKMYRNPDGKVIAGVSSGVATYFGVDVVVIRLLFVIFTIFVGTGLLIYIVLWIILPEARTITDKVQMQGEPVTLGNIESNIKKSLNVKEGEENIFVKILLFPFRLIAAVIQALGQALGPVMLFLVEFIRVAVGILFIILGASSIFTVVICLGIILGVFANGVWGAPHFIFQDIGFPIDALINSFPTFTALSAFFLILIPSIFLILMGASIVAKKIIFSTTVGWSLFAILIISGITLSINIPRMIYSFKEEGDREITQTYDLEGKTAVLKLKEVGLDDYDQTTLTIRGHKGANYELIQNYEALGKTRLEAIENTKMVDYEVAVNDSIFTFDSSIQFDKDAIFRNQQLSMILYIPYNTPFIMDKDLRYILRNTIYSNGYTVSDLDKNTWIFEENGNLKCTSCPPRQVSEDQNEISAIEFDRTYTFNSFDALEIESSFVVNIIKSSEFKVGLNGPKKYLDDAMVYVEGNKLYIENDSKFDLDKITNDALEVNIYVPELEEIEISGVSKLYMQDVSQRSLSISLSGASFARLSKVEIEDIDIELTGTSEIEIDGNGLNMVADIKGASHLNANDFEVKSAEVEAHGASSAKVFATERLTMDETFASNIKYRGNPEIISD